MTQQTMMAMGLLAAMLASPLQAQQSAAGHQDAAYRSPLAAQVQSQPAVPATPASRDSLPVFATGPSTAQRVAQNALIFAARSAVTVAAQKQGTYAPAPSATRQPYRPDTSVPEPATAERSCPPLGTPDLPAACVDRDALLTVDRNGIVSTTSTPR